MQTKLFSGNTIFRQFEILCLQRQCNCTRISIYQISGNLEPLC